ncbi:MAG: TonB-dependent receptor [Kangiellaceae bacterium]|nr:TonB-dependent receptor [Kangiellaceae bacterium]
MKSRKNYQLSLAAGLIIMSNQSFAEEGLSESAELDTTLQQEQTDKEIKVWGTKVQSSSVYLGETEMAMKQADHLSDLMRTIPGVDVGGAHSLNQRITIRSLEDKSLVVSIDGANQNTYMYHHMGNLQIHADILQSIEIEVGTNSVIDGGLGGAVRFKTKDAQDLLLAGDDFGGRVQFGYSSNEGDTASFTAYGQLSENFDWLFYHNQVNRGNYEVGGGKILNSDGDEIVGTDGKVRGLDGKIKDSLLKLGWDINDNQRFEFGYESYEDKGDYSYRPDMGLATDLSIGNTLGLPLTFDTEFSRDTIRFGYELSWGEKNELSATLFSNESTLWRDESAVADAFPGSASIVEGTATNTGLNVINSSVIGTNSNHHLTYGVDLIRFETEYRADGINASEEQATNTSLFIQDRIEFGQLAIIPGIRHDSVDLESAVVDKRFSDTTAGLAFEYQLTDHFLAKISSTQLFKAPEIGEVFIGAGLRDTANAEIKPETGLNSELSFAYTQSMNSDSKLTAGLTLFKTDIDDHIYDYAPPPAEVGGRSWKDNVGDMKIDGYEFYLGYDVKALSLLLSYSNAESELDAVAEYADTLDGARIDRQQGDTFSLNVDYDIDSIGLALHWDILNVSDVDAGLDLDGATLDNAKDSFTVHNVSAQWNPIQLEGLSVTVGVDNLFDEFYASQSSRTGTSFHPFFGPLYLVDYEPGRNIKATIAYQF